jgi:LDH2 family malate/lactate/ureidoglycolate dehydrogenase
MGTGHLLWAVDPVGLHGDDTAIGRAAGFQRRLRKTTPAQGVREVLSPGDVERRNAMDHAERVPMPASVLDDLATLADSPVVSGIHPLHEAVAAVDGLRRGEGTKVLIEPAR